MGSTANKYHFDRLDLGIASLFVVCGSPAQQAATNTSLGVISLRAAAHNLQNVYLRDPPSAARNVILPHVAPWHRVTCSSCQLNCSSRVSETGSQVSVLVVRM